MSEQKIKDAFAEFVAVIAKLRDPDGGCPWDLEQDHKSLRPYIVEETYETIEAIENENDDELVEELGDVLLQVVLHAQVAKDRGAFSILEIVETVKEKMIRRHPHVFGEAVAETSSQVLKNWEGIKREEKKKQNPDKSMLAGIPKAMPALLRAQRLGDKATRVNFDWDAIQGVLDKVSEEKLELEEEIAKVVDIEKISAEEKSKLEHELGDLLFSVCQLARWLGLNAENALRAGNDRFLDRFAKVEKIMGERLGQASVDELEAAWQKAKKM